MNSTRIIGVAMLVAGIVLLIIGLNASDSLADQVSETFTGRLTKATTWYIVGGIVAGVLGVLMVTVGGRWRRSSA